MSITTIRLYSTDIVQFNKNFIFLNSGGYRTQTTKRKMNEVSSTENLGFEVVQKNKIWEVNFKRQTFPFHDNMRLQR